MEPLHLSPSFILDLNTALILLLVSFAYHSFMMFKNALQQAVSGKEWTGWKLVEGRSNRKYTSEAAVAATVEGAGFDPYERKVLGVTSMQKLLGKTRFEELLAPYIEKPQGKPTLVPESDKRPAMNTAKNDFMEEF